LVKPWTELTTLAASLVTVAICTADGLDASVATELLSAPTEEEMALVWSGKLLLAELTSVLALLTIISTCDFRLLIPPLLVRFMLLSPLTEFSRLVRSVQYAGLLLLQPASTRTATAAAQDNRTRARPP
jgi:hypothetical protein